MIIYELRQKINDNWISKGLFKTYELAQNAFIKKDEIFKINELMVYEATADNNDFKKVCRYCGKPIAVGWKNVCQTHTPGRMRWDKPIIKS